MCDLGVPITAARAVRLASPPIPCCVSMAARRFPACHSGSKEGVCMCVCLPPRVGGRGTRRGTFGVLNGPWHSTKGDSQPPGSNLMPASANQMPAPGQTEALPTNRVVSGIAKGGTNGTWVYPSVRNPVSQINHPSPLTSFLPSFVSDSHSLHLSFHPSLRLSPTQHGPGTRPHAGARQHVQVQSMHDGRADIPRPAGANVLQLSEAQGQGSRRQGGWWLGRGHACMRAARAALIALQKAASNKYSHIHRHSHITKNKTKTSCRRPPPTERLQARPPLTGRRPCRRRM